MANHRLLSIRPKAFVRLLYNSPEKFCPARLSLIEAISDPWNVVRNFFG